MDVLTWVFALERVTGIEPALSAWESDQSGPLTALTWAVDLPLVPYQVTFAPAWRASSAATCTDRG